MTWGGGNEELLKITLQAAVPLWAERLKKVPLDDLIARAPELGQIIGEKGDVVQFKSKKKGESAAAFNALAEALAILSFQEGGVKFSGLHFQNDHPDRK